MESLIVYRPKNPRYKQPPNPVPISKSPPIPPPPLLRSPKPHQRLPPKRIAITQESRDIHVQGTLRARVSQELVDGRHCGGEGVGWGPVLGGEEG